MLGPEERFRQALASTTPEPDPNHVVSQVLGGKVLEFPRPGPLHVRAASFLGGLLTGPMCFGFGGPGSWWVLDEPQVHLGQDILVPDLAGWQKQRMPQLPVGEQFTVRPDWVCEVLHPGTERIDRTEKLFIYAREQVQHLWFLDPLRRTLEVMRLYQGHWTLLRMHTHQEVVRAEPFSMLTLDLRLLWGLGPG